MLSEIKNRKILITGGAGFIGSHLADRLLDMQYKVIVYDNLNHYYFGKEDNIRHNLNRKNFFFIKGDILDYELLLKSMKKVDVVFHLAAQPGVRFSMINPDKTLMVNVSGTLNILRASKERYVKKLIFASSSSVYGSTNRTPVNEQHPTNPASIYGASKLAAEKLCKIFYDCYGINVVILRYFTVYGPRQRPDMAIYKWVSQIYNNEPVTIYGDGRQTRDFTYIDDIVDATIKAAEVDGIEGEVFNIGRGNDISLNEVTHLLKKLTERDFKVVYEPPQYGDVLYTYADTSKAREALDYKPKTEFEHGLKNFIQWYNAHKIPRKLKL